MVQGQSAFHIVDTKTSIINCSGKYRKGKAGIQRFQQCSELLTTTIGDLVVPGLPHY